MTRLIFQRNEDRRRILAKRRKRKRYAIEVLSHISRHTWHYRDLSVASRRQVKGSRWSVGIDEIIAMENHRVWPISAGTDIRVRRAINRLLWRNWPASFSIVGKSRPGRSSRRNFDIALDHEQSRGGSTWRVGARIRDTRARTRMPLRYYQTPVAPTEHWLLSRI